jgi:Legume lectin domain
MRFSSRLVICTLVVVFWALPAMGQGFQFADFTSVENLFLNGSANHNGNKVQLTPESPYQGGSVWYGTKQNIANGFTSIFTFQVSNPSNLAVGGCCSTFPADGLAFVIQNNMTEGGPGVGTSTLAGVGGAMGYGPGTAFPIPIPCPILGCPQTTGIPNSLAIEFDTFQNNPFDPNNNHVGVQSCGTNPNTYDHGTCNLGLQAAPPFTIWDGNPHSIEVDYLPNVACGEGEGSLNIYLVNLPSFNSVTAKAPILNACVNLSSLLTLDGGAAWVGFTSATGGAEEDAELLDWEFDVTPRNGAFAPTSGAMLTILGSLATEPATPVDIVIYDSQFHPDPAFANPQAVPVGDGLSNCNANDALYVTDADVLQGGSSTGCNTGAYAITDGNSGTYQLPGKKDITKSAGQLSAGQLSAGPLGSVPLPGPFHIETHYCLNSSTCGAAGIATSNGSWCNTSTTICATPGSGFLSVTNNTTVPFTGTITLQGNSPICGAANDSVTYSVESPLNSSVALALGSAGDPTYIDSKTCGGFNFDQQAPLLNSPNPPAVFQAHNDNFVVQCSNCNLGDVATWQPVPVPQKLFAVANGSTVGTNPPETCITFADFSSPNPAHPNGVCPLFQTHCHNINGLNDDKGNCLDAESFTWFGTYDYIIDKYTIPNPVGGVHFLGAPMVNCEASLIYSTDIGVDYTGAQPGVDPIPPQHSGGKGGLNCFVATEEPSAPAIPVGVKATAFNGWKPPVVNSDALVLNPVFPIEPLGFQVSNGAGGTPITNLHWCPDPTKTTSPTGCGTKYFQIPQPWVTFSQIPIGAPLPPGCPAANFPQEAIPGFLLNLGKGNYWFLWTPEIREDDGCATVQVQLSFGATAQPAVFIYP